MRASSRDLVDLVGIEPTTSSMPWKRAPSCATGPRTRDTYTSVALTSIILAHDSEIVNESRVCSLDSQGWPPHSVPRTVVFLVEEKSAQPTRKAMIGKAPDLAPVADFVDERIRG